MFSPRIFHAIFLAWFFGWGFLLLKFPAPIANYGDTGSFSAECSIDPLIT
jgi:hypothetical protein